MAYAETIELKLGDVDGNGVVNDADVTMLKNYLLASYTSQILPVSADANNDGTIDVSDITAIKNIMATGTPTKTSNSVLFFSNAEVAKLFGGTLTNPIVRGGSTGAITYESSNTAVATVNASTGEVTYVSGSGTTTITATLAADGNYTSTTAQFTLTVQPFTTLAGLKAYTGTKKAFLGYYVDNSGNIHETKQTGDIGVIAYIGTNVDTHTDLSGKTILIIELSTENKDYDWASVNETSGASTDTNAMDGYSNTQILNNKYGASYAGGKAWSKGTPGFSGASHWFLPSFNQWKKMTSTSTGIGGKKMIEKTGMPSGQYWASTEFAMENNKAWWKSVSTTSSSSSRFVLVTAINKIGYSSTVGVRACFAY